MTEPTDWPHMLPCPFCGGDARHDAHADDCYFILHRKFKNSGADMSLAFEVLAAWNRRTPQPTQPQAGAVPLTDEQIELLMRSIGTTYADDNDERMKNHAGWQRMNHRQIVRAIEAAHGITGGRHGAE